MCLRCDSIWFVGKLQNFNRYFKPQYWRLQVVSTDDLKDDSEFAEIVEDMREECGKYGKHMVDVLIHLLLRIFSEHVSPHCVLSITDRVCSLPWLVIVSLVAEK